MVISLGIRRDNPLMERSPFHEFHHQASSVLILLQSKNLHHRGVIHQLGEDRLIPQKHQMFLVIRK